MLRVAVYLTYAGAGGHALIDRELYLPNSWTGDAARRAAAGVAEGIERHPQSAGPRPP